MFVGVSVALDRGLVSGPAPPFEGSLLDGRPFATAQLSGTPALIYFWASWCPICTAMQGTIASLAGDYPLVTVAMQSGGQAELERYVREHGFDVPVFPDPRGDLATRYGLRGVPAIFVLDGNGTIRFALTGYATELGLRLRLWWASWFVGAA